MDPSSDAVSTDEGRRLLKQGNVDEAIEVLKKVVEQSPDDAQAHSCLGVAYNMKGDRLHAVAQFEKSLRLEESAKAYYNLGLVYEQGRRIDEAVREYRMAVELDPDYEPAKAALDRLRSQFEAEQAQAAPAAPPPPDQTQSMAPPPGGPQPTQAFAGPPSAMVGQAPPVFDPVVASPHGGPDHDAYVREQQRKEEAIKEAHHALMKSGVAYGAMCGAFFFVLVHIGFSVLGMAFGGGVTLLGIIINAVLGAIYGILIGLWIGYTAGDDMSGAQAGAALGFVGGFILGVIAGGIGMAILMGVMFAMLSGVVGLIIGKMVAASIGQV